MYGGQGRKFTGKGQRDHIRRFADHVLQEVGNGILIELWAIEPVRPFGKTKTRQVQHIHWPCLPVMVKQGPHFKSAGSRVDAVQEYQGRAFLGVIDVIAQPPRASGLKIQPVRFKRFRQLEAVVDKALAVNDPTGRSRQGCADQTPKAP